MILKINQSHAAEGQYAPLTIWNIHPSLVHVWNTFL